VWLPTRNRVDDPITHEQLRQALRYEPDTGKWFWLVNIRNAKPGDEAGCYNGNASGYAIIGINGRQYYAHVLAWFYMTGKWPDHEIDHEDVDGFNNKWVNLRAATHAQNGWNRSLTARNKVGYKGVCPYGDRFIVKITHNDKVEQLGIFDSAVEAAKVYDAAARRFHGSFARTNFEEA